MMARNVIPKALVVEDVCDKFHGFTRKKFQPYIKVASRNCSNEWK